MTQSTNPLGTALRESRLATLSTSLEHSFIVHHLAWTLKQTARWAKSSIIYRMTQAYPTVWYHSRSNVFLDVMVAWARGSILYRWFTAEPDPEIIVIDLRDTYTVAPFIALLDRLIAALSPAYRRSRLRKLGWGTAKIIESAPIRAVSLVLLPVLVVVLITQILNASLSFQGTVPVLVMLGLAAAGTRSHRSWKELQDTRLVRLLTAVLEPPTPPEQPAGSDEEADDSVDDPL